MRKTYLFPLFLSFVISIVLLSISEVAAQEPPRLVDSRDYAVMLSVDVNDVDNTITLTWDNNGLVEKYTIRKREIGKPWWGSVIAEVDGSASAWEDTDVAPGEIYEYEVTAHSLGSFNVRGKINNETVDSTVAREFQGFGYITAGMEAPPADDVGKVLVLVDETMAEPLAMELERLGDDLAKEGWTVVMNYVARTEQFDGNAVIDVKKIILDEYDIDDAQLTTVFLIGRVAVPYSGNINPDGHPDHIGAWPADIYYGVMKESNWTDEVIDNDTTASRDANKNIIGDGKFDNSTVNTNSVDLAVGRVDFYNMPMFYDNSFDDPEIELIRNYLNKDHLFRTNQIEYGLRGMIEDNFKVKSRRYEGFASSGWRNFSVIVGHENVSTQDWLATLSTESYLLSYGTGGGNYTSCGGVATSQNIADAEGINSVFMMLFGSYFGDWDSKNNILRAPLCTNPSALTNCWSARPSWFIHHMGLGKNIGYSTVLSQNNYQDYKTILLAFHPFAPFQDYPNLILYHIGMNMVHTALMGDPTLRMLTGVVPSPQNLSIIQPPGEFVEISWEPPANGEITYYNIFSSRGKWGPWEKLNDDPMLETGFIDENLVEGEVFYMVKAYQLQEVPSGTYYNDSRGIIASAGITSVEEQKQTKAKMICSPNPAFDYLEIDLILPSYQSIKLHIYDMKGNIIKQISNRELAPGRHYMSWDLLDAGGNKVSPGVYFIKLMAGQSVIVEKIIVLG